MATTFDICKSPCSGVFNRFANYDIYKNKGLSGLVNLGNTCFINTCMQLLSHTYELNEFLDKETYKAARIYAIPSQQQQQLQQPSPDFTLLTEWDELRKLLWSTNCVVSPNRFVSTIQKVAEQKGRVLFTGFAQNDLPEFLIFIIDCFHTALSRKVSMYICGKPENELDHLAIQCFERIKNMYANDFSEIWQLFYGISISKIQKLETIAHNNATSVCSVDDVISITPEPFFIIDLPIPMTNKTIAHETMNISLLDCFDFYVAGEDIYDYKNEKSGQVEHVRKKMEFWSLPKILVIDLKRAASLHKKNQQHIDYPLENLNLSKYVVGYNKDSYVYDLYGIGCHSGSLLGGHYTCFVRNANNKWYHFNDTAVSEISENMHHLLVSARAYCLFYRKKVC